MIKLPDYAIYKKMVDVNKNGKADHEKPGIKMTQGIYFDINKMRNGFKYKNSCGNQHNHFKGDQKVLLVAFFFSSDFKSVCKWQVLK